MALSANLRLCAVAVGKFYCSVIQLIQYNFGLSRLIASKIAICEQNLCHFIEKVYIVRIPLFIVRMSQIRRPHSTKQCPLLALPLHFSKLTYAPVLIRTFLGTNFQKGLYFGDHTLKIKCKIYSPST